MPKIQAFRGLRFNLARVGSLGSVVAARSNHESEWSKLSPANEFNVDQLLQPTAVDADAWSDTTQQVGRLFRHWLRDGILQYEPDPALYVHHEIRQPNDPNSPVRCSLFAVGEFQSTQSLNWSRAIEVDTVPKRVLYSDPANAVQNIIEAFIVGKAGLEALDPKGHLHRIWPVSDQDTIAEVANRIEALPAALIQRDASEPAEGEAGWHLAEFISTHEPGLQLLPEFGWFPNADGSCTPASIADRLAPFFDCDVIGVGDSAAEELEGHLQDLNDPGASGIWLGSSDQWLLLTENPQAGELPTDSKAVLGNQGRILDLLQLDPTSSHRSFCSLSELREVVREQHDSTSGMVTWTLPPSPEQLDQLIREERFPFEKKVVDPSCVSGLVLRAR